MQEIKTNLYFFTFLRCNTSDEPLLTFSFGNNQVFTQRSCQNPGLIPGYRHTGHEIRTFFFFQIKSRIVCHHLKTTFKSYIQSHLISTSTYGSIVRIMTYKIFRLHRKHGTRCIIHRTYSISHKRMIQTVGRSTELTLFHAQHTFV